MSTVVFADNDYLRNVLLANGMLLQEFAVIRSFRDQMLQLDKQCTSCSGKKASIEKRDELFNTIRQTLAGFGPEQKQKIRSALGVDSVRVPYHVTDANQRKKLVHGVI